MQFYLVSSPSNCQVKVNYCAHNNDPSRAQKHAVTLGAAHIPTFALFIINSS